MAATNYSISWDPFQKNVAEGLSTLQQNEELVDMTIAADGHYVKVHQLMMALNSPYLKQLISAAPCQHPVLFLNDVSMQTLSLLLEFIYTGQVVVPENNLKEFSKLGRSLHIKGLQELALNHKVSKTVNIPLTSTITKVVESPAKSKIHSRVDTALGATNIPLYTGNSTPQLTIPPQAKNIKVLKNMVEQKMQFPECKTSAPTITNPPNMESNQKPYKINEPMDAESDNDFNANNSDDFTRSPHKTETTKSLPPDKEKLHVQYSTSIRGNLQVILNRYIYNFISLNSRTGERKWRCINYRENRCLAFVNTKGNVVLKRGNMHNHPFHDSKILDKMLKNAVFSTISDAERFSTVEESSNKQKDSTRSDQEFSYISD